MYLFSVYNNIQCISLLPTSEGWSFTCAKDILINVWISNLLYVLDYELITLF